MLNDPLSNALSKILAYEKISKKECLVKSSKIIKQVLEIMHTKGYLGSVEEIKSSRGDQLNVNLIGAINKCGVIKPRFSAKKEEITKFENRYLPAQDFGIIVVSTSQGIMTHDEAKEKKLEESYSHFVIKMDTLEKIVEIGEVKAEVANNTVKISGPKGEIERIFREKLVEISLKDGSIIIKALHTNRNAKRMMNTIHAHIVNIIHGVKEGYEYQLKVCSGHFPMNVSVAGKEITIKNFIGEKNPRKCKIKQNVEIKLEKDIITVSGINKEEVGQAAAEIEKSTKIKDKDRRIFMDGIFIISKA